MAADDLDENAAMLARVLVASIDASGTPTESPDFEILFGDFAAETPAVGADELLWAFKKCTCRNRCCALSCEACGMAQPTVVTAVPPGFAGALAPGFLCAPSISPFAHCSFFPTRVERVSVGALFVPVGMGNVCDVRLNFALYRVCAFIR